MRQSAMVVGGVHDYSVAVPELRNDEREAEAKCVERYHDRIVINGLRMARNTSPKSPLLVMIQVDALQLPLDRRKIGTLDNLWRNSKSRGKFEQKKKENSAKRRDVIITCLVEACVAPSQGTRCINEIVFGTRNLGISILLLQLCSFGASCTFAETVSV